MAFVELPMDPEDLDKPVAEGEYELIVTDVQEKMDDNGNLKGLLIIHEIVGMPDASNVLHNISFPLPEDDAEKAKNKIRFMKLYHHLFNIPFNGSSVDTSKYFGARARVNLTIEEWNGVQSNRIKLR